MLICISPSSFFLLFFQCFQRSIFVYARSLRSIIRNKLKFTYRKEKSKNRKIKSQILENFHNEWLSLLDRIISSFSRLRCVALFIWKSIIFQNSRSGAFDWQIIEKSENCRSVIDTYVFNRGMSAFDAVRYWMVCIQSVLKIFLHKFYEYF